MDRMYYIFFTPNLVQSILMEQLLTNLSSRSGEMVYFAALCTAGIFAAFTFSALLCERRSYLYLGGLLGSVLNLLLWSQVFNMFFRSKLLWSIELYTGLFMFCGYSKYTL